MLITKIIDDKSPINHQLEMPTLQNVEEAIYSLDGESVSLVDFYIQNKNYLTVAGGNQGKYICFITEKKNGSCWSLLNVETNWDLTDELVVGGSKGIFSYKHFQNLETIFEIAYYFAEYGEKHPDYLWEENSSAI